jgi:hypothetical protein
MRKLDAIEFSAKKERADTVTERKGELEALRKSWERIGNRYLERHGFEPMLDRRPLLDQGVNREPTIHPGKATGAPITSAAGSKPASYPKALNQSPISLL